MKKRQLQSEHNKNEMRLSPMKRRRNFAAGEISFKKCSLQSEKQKKLQVAPNSIFYYHFQPFSFQACFQLSTRQKGFSVFFVSEFYCQIFIYILSFRYLIAILMNSNQIMLG